MNKSNSLHSKLVSRVLLLTISIFTAVFGVFFYITKQQLNTDNCERVAATLQYEERDINAEVNALGDTVILTDSILYSIITKHLYEVKNPKNTLYTFLSDSSSIYYYGDPLSKEGLAIKNKFSKKLPAIISGEKRNQVLEEGTYNYFFTYLPKIDRYFMAATRDFDFMKEVYTMAAVAIVLMLVFITALWTLLGKSVSSIVKPLNQLAITAKNISGGDFFTTIPDDKSFAEIDSLRESFTSMQSSLDDYMKNLERTTIDKEKIENDLEIAHSIQMSMLPAALDSRIEAKLVPAREVGGDIYDYVISGDDIYVMISDVSGKGVPAALVASSIQSIFRSLVSLEASPKEIISAMNKVISKNNSRNMFATVFLCRIDTESGKMVYCNAGHNPPFIIEKSAEAGKKARVRKLNVENNLPVGLFEGFEYAQQEECCRGTIVLYTDGVVEAENEADALLGEASLINLIESHPVKGLTEAIFSLVREFAGEAPQSDDITVCQVTW